jgi:hypothetical protein
VSEGFVAAEEGQVFEHAEEDLLGEVLLHFGWDAPASGGVEDAAEMLIDEPGGGGLITLVQPCFDGGLVRGDHKAWIRER